MHYTALGRSGAVVSRIALGTMNMGPIVDQEESFRLLDHARDQGITFFDTADVYGGAPWGDHPGQTENIVGQWLHSRGCRDDVVLATKVHGPMGPGGNESGLSALYIRRAVDASLRRLKTDHIDLYQMHHIDRTVPADEVLAAFSLLHAQGKITYLGSSNFAGWNIAQYRELAAATGGLPLVTEQSVYSLLKRDIELEVVPATRHYAMGLLPWSPLASGLLGGVLAKSTAGPRSSRAPIDGLLRSQLEEFETFARQRNLAPAILGLAWLLAQPVVTAPVVGPRTTAHIDDAVAALDVELTPDDLARLDAIFPGPGGQAPEAYAW
ncbi:aldo/keto reductase [Nakamurella deserti]|uniref:aldo/keto reductase n=1 Tax=Nakamurella deserti TaxID=2164074 RepID=UPI000DBE6C3E|nr:aldo/keto reductase [Nakamurella deserti]